jgi:hypothetical protein
MVVMLDIDFIRTESKTKEIILYRYRSGTLRDAVVNRFMDRARAKGLMVSERSVEDLAVNWANPDLWSSVRVCDLPRHASAFRAIKEKLSKAPGGTTLMTVAAQKSNAIRHSAVTVIDEPVAWERNIARIVDFAAQTRGLPGTQDLATVSALHSYFRIWIRTEQETDLQRALREFDRVVLLYWNHNEGRLNLPPVVAPSPAQRSFLVKALTRFASNPGTSERIHVMNAFTLRLERAGISAALTDLFAGSVRVARSVHHRRGRGLEKLGASAEAALLWATLSLIYCDKLWKEQDAEAVITATHHAFVSYSRRLDQLQGDPLEGHWEQLRNCLEGQWDAYDEIDLVEDREVDPRQVLVSLWRKARDQHKDIPWLSRLSQLAENKRSKPAHTILQDFVSVAPIKDLNSLVQIVGQPHIVKAICRRVQSGEHSRPLLLSGPPGSGKRSLARLYAKRLLCEIAMSDQLDPCGNCQECNAFASGSLWGLLEFDMARLDIVENTRYHLEQLKFEPLSERRAIILRDPDYSDEATDAFLKTLEKGAKATTFIVLTSDERKTRSAILSRCDRFAVRPLRGNDAHELIGRWLPAERSQSWLLEFIAMHGLGRPGVMYHLSRMVAQRSAWTLEDVKGIFNLTWPSQLLDKLQATFGKSHENKGVNLDPDHLAVGIRLIGSYLIDLPKRDEEALMGHEQDLMGLGSILDEWATQQGLPCDEMRIRLVSHWTSKEIIDDDCFLEPFRLG